MVKILLVEDEKHIINFLRRGLMLKGFEVRTAENGEQALKLVQAEEPDLLLLDIMLPDMSGIEICHYLRETGYTLLPIIMLTARDSQVDKITGLDTGADDYITKPFDFEELVARIRSALRRVAELHAQVQTITVGDLRLDSAARQVWRGDIPIDLTKREFDLLELLAQNAGHVLTRERILERVWGYDSETGQEIIKVYINYLRSKLNVAGKPDLIHAVRGIGYTLKATTE